MIKTLIATALLTATIATAPAPAHKEKAWKDGGEYRISAFCQFCNEQEGFQSASGKTLEYGHVAMNGVPFGTKISIDGEVFTVTDRVGVPDTVDIFIPSSDGCCHCNKLEYKKVYIKTNKKKGGRN